MTRLPATMPISISDARLSRRRFMAMSGGAFAILIGGGERAAFAQATPTAADAATGVFLDSGVVHPIVATFDRDAYDAMIDAYSSSGDKEWVEATVIIDGEAYDRVGMRLKGNSSLMGLRGDNGATQQQGDGNTRRDFGGPSLSADEPESLPWLVRLDKYVDDQNHDGLTEFVIRSNNSQTSLNEAVALDLLAAAGLASQAAAPVAFSVNGSEPRLRLAIENPDDVWMAAHFSADGILYKSEAEGDWSYRGTDADAYKDAFDLEAGGKGDDASDMQPLIAFMDFLNNSDDATFAQELPERLDIDAFATYMAAMDLVDNFDAIDGPGNNSYLYYGPDAEQFTVVPWDMNLSFGGMGMGGGPMVRIDGQGPGGAPPTGADASGTPSADSPFPTDGQGAFPSGTPTVAFNGPGGGPGGMGPRSNPLVDRFNANADFAALIPAATTRLQDDLYNSGLAATILAGRVAVLKDGALSMVDQATITSESDTIAAFFEPAS